MKRNAGGLVELMLGFLILSVVIAFAMKTVTFSSLCVGLLSPIGCQNSINRKRSAPSSLIMDEKLSGRNMKRLTFCYFIPRRVECSFHKTEPSEKYGTAILREKPCFIPRKAL